ncbi:GntR family transcriptional regulator [Azospirillum sp. YIM B02556]|uniref:GntR family transcriptional regulator n=1 Tax=Azospirillum endophyticum TaxID=2800326 RepID=A0ABS1FFA4_9PROT|nr:GntR family transcriptional regulator [Azospirillum endophyticum]MBK1842084.1 GntR family transcriptional regulator [Azospirillum endophyticum]
MSVAAERDAQPLGEKLFQQIVDIINSGEIAPGSELNEAALAQRFGVSRGPVREAVRRLQGIGLISREPYMRARVISLETREVIELFQMREALEGMACRLAAENMSSEEAARLLADLESDRNSWTTGQPSRAFDFHSRIVEACGNRRIIESLNGDLHQLFRLYRRKSGMDRARKIAAYQEHWQILRAIINRDPELAESMMRSHIARASANLARTDDAGVPQINWSGTPGQG